MMPPAVAAGRFATAFVLGLGLGLFYGFLRPLRRCRNWPADLIFLGGLFQAWLWHSFSLCRGDIRLWGLGGLLLGCVVWNWTAGRLLNSFFYRFWDGVRQIFRFFLWPFTKIFLFFIDFVKKLFASGKKSGTIKRKRKNRE